MATTIHETEDLARRAIEALNHRDQDAFIETHAEDVILHHPRETYRGIEEVVDFQWATFDAFSDLTFAIEAVCAGMISLRPATRSPTCTTKNSITYPRP